MDERERSALMRLGKGFLALSLALVGALVADIVVGFVTYVTGYQVGVSMLFFVIMRAAIVMMFMFTMALILFGLFELLLVDDEFIVGYVGMFVLMLGYFNIVFVDTVVLLAGEATLEAVSPIMDAANITIIVGYAMTFFLSTMSLWRRYRGPLYMAAAIFYTATTIVPFLSPNMPPLFIITANALMYAALKATIRHVET